MGSLPHLWPDSAFLTLCLEHSHKNQFSIYEIDLSVADSSAVSATVGCKLGTDIEFDAEQFCLQYCSLMNRSFKCRIDSFMLRTNCKPLYSCFYFIFLPLSPTIKNCKAPGSCFIVFDSIKNFRLPFNPSFTS